MLLELIHLLLLEGDHAIQSFLQPSVFICGKRMSQWATEWRKSQSSTWYIQSSVPACLFRWLGNGHWALLWRGYHWLTNVSGKQWDALCLFPGRPHSTDSATHRKMTLSLADRCSKTQKIRILPMAGRDPECQRTEMIKVCLLSLILGFFVN